MWYVPLPHRIHDQLVFLVQALQQLCSYLEDNEDEKTLFLSYCEKLIPYKNMLLIQPHTYAVGKFHYADLTVNEHAAISVQSLDSVGQRLETFSRIFFCTSQPSTREKGESERVPFAAIVTGSA